MSKKKKVIPRWKKLLVAALAAGTIGGGAIAAGNINYFRGEKVIAVYDGDTFIIENKQPIRLYGANAPELENCLGQNAKRALSELILGKRVQLREPITDTRRRVMALVYVNGVFVNETMIRAGLAKYENYSGSQTTRMGKASTDARESHIGIYSPTCYQPEPPNSKCRVKGNYDTFRYEKIYYIPTCEYYSRVNIWKFEGDAWFCTEKEARAAGFEKSETCK